MAESTCIAPLAPVDAASMHTQLLIDAIVRQVTVLLAQLATSGGVRAPVAHIANQVFVELSNELAAQGVSRKVSADMFGMALRAYLRKLRRLSESATERDRTLWRAVLDALSEQGAMTREQVLRRFHRDDEAQVRAVLHDLTESGLVFVAGAAANTLYRAASEDELSTLRQHASDDGLDELIWVIVYREGPLTRDALDKRVRMPAARLSAVLERLVAAGRVQPTDAAAPAYRATDLSVPYGAPVGWEAAVFDHFQAMVQTICQRLAATARVANPNDSIGGSTYSFDVSKDHALAPEVYGLLQRYRAELSALRARVDAHNRAHPSTDEAQQVVFYLGQCLRDLTPPEPTEDEDQDA